MADKKLIILLAIIVTAIIFLSPLSFSRRHCECGGCCIGCPGDCNAIGAPFALYYWGANGLSGEIVNQLSAFGLLADVIAWGTLMFLIHRYVCGK